MNNLMQSALTGMLALGLLAPVDNFAQSTSPSPTGEIILEVIATYNGMQCSQCADRYVYLRVFSDGTAECQSSTRSAAEPKESPTIKKKTLTQDEFIQIKRAVNAPKLAKVGPKYETWYAIVDASLRWTIKIPRPGQSQIIEVLEFSPALTKTMKHPYPDALVKLGCNIEKLRDDVSGEPHSLDSECQRVLGTANQPD